VLVLWCLLQPSESCRARSVIPGIPDRRLQRGDGVGLRPELGHEPFGLRLLCGQLGGLGVRLGLGDVVLVLDEQPSPDERHEEE
jgi:hypothetical protein